MEILLNSLRSEWHAFLTAAPRLAMAVLVFIVIAILGRFVARGVRLVMQRGNFAETHRDFFRRLIAWLFYLIGFAASLNVMGFSGVAASILTGGGVTAVVLGFAFREIGENFLAGFFLAFNRPFNLGDLVQSGDTEGIVKGISLRSTHIRTADGKDVFVPSSQIFKNPLVNYTIDGLRRFRFTVGIDYGDDPDAAAVLLLKTMRQQAQVLAEPEPFVGIDKLAPAWVELALSYWVNTFDPDLDAVALRSAIMADCRRALIENGFTTSADVTTNLALRSRAPVELSVKNPDHS